MRYLQHYAPDKVANADAMLQKYVGKEEELMKTLVSKLGPEPPSVDTSRAASIAPPPAGHELPSRAASVAPSTFRDRLVRYLQHYAPDKVVNADAMLQKYVGKEEELMKTLVSKLGPEPPMHSVEPLSVEPPITTTTKGADHHGGFQTTTDSVPLTGPFRDRLVRFYAHYAPEKLSQVDAALHSFRGNETQMFQKLVEKYGPEVPPTPPLGSTPLPALDPAASADGATEVHERSLPGAASMAPPRAAPPPQAAALSAAASSSLPTDVRPLLERMAGSKGQVDAFVAALRRVCPTLSEGRALVVGIFAELYLETSTPTREPPTDEPRGMVAERWGAQDRVSGGGEGRTALLPTLRATPPTSALGVSTRSLAAWLLAQQPAAVGGGVGPQSRKGPTGPHSDDGDEEDWVLAGMVATLRRFVQCVGDQAQDEAYLEGQEAVERAQIAMERLADRRHAFDEERRRKDHFLRVVQQAIALIDSVEGSHRDDVQHAESVEREGRMKWFRTSLQEIQLTCPSSRIAALEARMQEWRRLVNQNDDQRRYMAAYLHEGETSFTPSPPPPAGRLVTPRRETAVPRRTASPGMSYVDPAVAVITRILARAATAQSPINTPRGASPAASSRGATGRVTPQRATSPAATRSTTLTSQRRPAWNQHQPQSINPSTACVDLVRATGIPPPLRRPGTFPEPFYFSTVIRQASKRSTTPPATAR